MKSSLEAVLNDIILLSEAITRVESIQNTEVSEQDKTSFYQESGEILTGLFKRFKEEK